MHHALAAERHKIRLRAAPARQSRSPLARSRQIEDVMTSADHGAVDDADSFRRHIAYGSRDHDLIEQRAGRSDFAAQHHHPGQHQAAEHIQLGIRETSADLDCLAGRIVRSRQVALRQVIARGQHEH